MDKIYKHPRLGDILLRQRWTTSRISLSVKHTGEVRLSYPRLVSTAKALRFLEEKVEWVLQMRARVAEKVMPSSDYSPAQIEELRREAKRTLPAMVERLARQYGFSYGRVTIRATRSKWGCCTSKNNLSLSLFLMTLPTHLQEFVVLHELCHTVHHNHSAEFHALLNKVTGGREKELNRQLKGIRKNLRFRKGTTADIGRIMEIVADAQSWFRRNNIDQWQDGYPTEKIILSDIEGGVNYLIECNGVIVAMVVIIFGEEPTYKVIKGKGWLNDSPYAVVHRIAVADDHRKKGIAREIMHFVEELCIERGVSDIRIDTHEDNIAMRSMLTKLGYKYCGVVTMESGAPRVAYQKSNIH